MDMSAHPNLLSPQEYLEIERAAEFRSEYYGGRMYAMSGGSVRHSVLIASLARELGIALKGRPCSVASSDLRLRVSPGGLYTYPDVVIFCGEAQVADDQKDTLLNPTLVLEVLSPSTEGYDRGWKFSQYRKIESLQEYALVAQNEPHIDIFRRQANGVWTLSEAEGIAAFCQLTSINVSLSLAEVYDKITFTEDTTSPRPSPGV